MQEEFNSEKAYRATGVKRLVRAFGFSMAGLAVAYGRESAFRQEVWLAGLLSLVSFGLPASLAWHLVLVAVWWIVVIIELLNSAVESVVDLVSPEFHPLAKYAKDMGSAAVLLALILAGSTWCVYFLSQD